MQNRYQIELVHFPLFGLFLKESKNAFPLSVVERAVSFFLSLLFGASVWRAFGDLGPRLPSLGGSSRAAT